MSKELDYLELLTLNGFTFSAMLKWYISTTNCSVYKDSGGFMISSGGWRVFLDLSSGGGDNLPGGGEKIAL